jgi:4-amino-4-deoxy-L-arabinose transferase-like glycosyltransferase
MKAKLQNLVETYGRRAFYLYVGICLVNFGVVFGLLRAGMQDLFPASILAYLPAHSGATLIGAYAIYKAMQIPRIAFAVVVIPILTRWIWRAPPAVAERAAEAPPAPAPPVESAG